MNSSAASSGCSEKRRASEYTESTASNENPMYAAWKGTSLTSPSDGQQRRLHPRIARWMRIAAEGDVPTLEHEPGMIRMQRIDLRMFRRRDVVGFIAANRLIQERRANGYGQHHQQQNIAQHFSPSLAHNSAT